MHPKPRTIGVSLVATSKETNQFIRFQYDHYKNDRFWVPPLVSEQKKLLDTSKNPFYRNGEIALFLAEKDGIPAGRIAAVIDHRYNDFHSDKTGFFGFFESVDSQDVTNLLVKVASDWLKQKGMERVLGPSNPGMMDEVGILVDGFEEYPYIMMPYHKPYYDKLLTAAGLKKATDLYAFEVDQATVNRERMNRAVEIVKKRIPGLTIREVRVKELSSELVIIRNIFNQAWRENWGFIPLSEEEFDALAADLKMILDTDIAHIAEINGEAVAFSVALPDYNQVFRRMNGKLFPLGIFKLLYYSRKINRIRTALMGVLPEYRGKGIDALLHNEAIEKGLKKGYFASELSWVLESNHDMIRVAEKIGGKKSRTYRMYEGLL